LLGLSLVANGQTVHVGKSGWVNDYNLAQEIAERENKRMLIYFTGSDWCHPCKLLSTDLFETERFNTLASKSFVLYEADFPRHQNTISKSRSKMNRRLLNRYDVNTFPTLVIVSARGKKLGHISGYSSTRDTQYHYNLFDRVINE
jgi:thioredoxin-related protein